VAPPPTLVPARQELIVAMEEWHKRIPIYLLIMRDWMGVEVRKASAARELNWGLGVAFGMRFALLVGARCARIGL
jgi:hypothetical protein